MLSPGVYDLCSPASSAKEDATRGEWQRIDKDVSKHVGVYYLYIYARACSRNEYLARRTLTRARAAGRLMPGSDADVITDIRLLNHTAQIADLSEDGLWVEVSTSLREGVWPRMDPLFLHYKLSSQSSVRAARRGSSDNDAGSLEPITQLDVLYGADEVSPLPGYAKIDVPITGGLDDPKRIGNGNGKGTRPGASLAYRRKSPSEFSLSRSSRTRGHESLTLGGSPSQSFRRRRRFASTPRATSRSCKSPTCTSPSVPANAAMSTRSKRASASASAPTSTVSAGSRLRSTKSSRIWSFSAVTN